jgi:hypothetical protein
MQRCWHSPSGMADTFMPTAETMSIVRAARDRAAFTTVVAESQLLQRPAIEEDLVVVPVVIIPNHAPATNNLFYINGLASTCPPARCCYDMGWQSL